MCLAAGLVALTLGCGGSNPAAPSAVGAGSVGPSVNPIATPTSSTAPASSRARNRETEEEQPALPSRPHGPKPKKNKPGEPDPEPDPTSPESEPEPEPDPDPPPPDSDPDPLPPDPDPDPPPPDPEPDPDPDPGPTAPPPAPNGLDLTWARSVSNSEIRLSWNSVAAAESYVVELGDGSGKKNLGTFSVSGTSFDTDDLPPGRVYARVKAENSAGTSPASGEKNEWFFDMKDYIEAIFLGTGPLRPSDGNHGCSATGWVRGFDRGTTVDLLVSTTVSSDKVSAIEDAADQVSSATAGAVHVNFSQTSDPDPIPGQDEVTSTTHPSPSSVGCGSNSGCTIHKFISNSSPGRYYSSRAVQPSGQTPEAYAHDAVGHGIVGLCHVDGNLIGGAGKSLMSAGPGIYSGAISDDLTTYDIDAARALYQAGLEAGDRRSDLLSKGLINP